VKKQNWAVSIANDLNGAKAHDPVMMLFYPSANADGIYTYQHLMKTNLLIQCQF
jgi:hypothetical protein